MGDVGIKYSQSEKNDYICYMPERSELAPPQSTAPHAKDMHKLDYVKTGTCSRTPRRKISNSITNKK
jgi:hypothetical protein